MACQKTHLPTEVARSRKTWARTHNWPLSKWKKVRFYDEVHYGQSPKRKLKIIREERERYCDDCIQRGVKQDGRDVCRYHACALVGWNYKSPIFLYDCKNKTGSLTQQAFVDRILKPFIQPLVEKGEIPILELDNDSSHGTFSNDNIAKRYLEALGVEWHANPSRSPDLAVIEKAWRMQKRKLNEEDWFNGEMLKEGIHSAWDQVLINSINKAV